MENLDLNINNYELQDIFNLFEINNQFGETELKICKKKVLMTHPDKSNLKKDYFLFFLKAYKILYQIHVFKNNSNKDDTLEYTEVVEDINNSSSLSLIKFSKVLIELIIGLNNWLDCFKELIKILSNLSMLTFFFSEYSHTNGVILLIPSSVDFSTNHSNLDTFFNGDRAM